MLISIPKITGRASHQYREALLFDPNDKGTAEMLVISLKYAGCTNEASLAARKYQLDESGLFSKAWALCSYTNNNQKNINTQLNDSEVYGFLSKEGTHINLNGGFNIIPMDGISLTANYNFQNINTDQTVFYNEPAEVTFTQQNYTWGFTRNYDFPYSFSEEVYNGNIKQREYYLKATIDINPGLKFKAAINLVSIDLDYLNVSTTYQDQIDTAVFYFESEYAETFEYQTYQYGFSVEGIHLSRSLYLLGISKSFDKMEFSFNLSKSNFWNTDQYQGGFYFSWFPKGNMKYLFRTGHILRHENGVNYYNTDNLISVALFSRLWVNGWLQAGKLNNSSFADGSILLNKTDEVDLITGGGLSFLASQHFIFNLNYSLQQKKQAFYTYASEKESNFVQQQYFAHTFSGGIIWKF